jgi:hypothetical protein
MSVGSLLLTGDQLSLSHTLTLAWCLFLACPPPPLCPLPLIIYISYYYSTHPLSSTAIPISYSCRTPFLAAISSGDLALRRCCLLQALAQLPHAITGCDAHGLTFISGYFHSLFGRVFVTVESRLRVAVITGFGPTPVVLDFRSGGSACACWDVTMGLMLTGFDKFFFLN